MSRLRLNDVSGTAVGNPITLASATTNACSWTSSPAFPLISAPDYAVIVCAPDTATEEIIHLVGFMPGRTTGLVCRAAEPNALALQVANTQSGVAWVHGPSALDYKSTPTRVFSRIAFR
jgi:hypothetical protein